MLRWRVHQAKSHFQFGIELGSVISNGPYPEDTQFFALNTVWVITREMQVEVEVIRRDANLLTEHNQLLLNSREVHDFDA